MKQGIRALLGLILFLGVGLCARADMLAINVEYSKGVQGQTLVSLRCGDLTKYNRDNVSVQDAAQVLRGIVFIKDGKFAVVHSRDLIPVSDLIPILEAMSANDIGLEYLQIGSRTPTGLDIWNRK